VNKAQILTITQQAPKKTQQPFIFKNKTRQNTALDRTPKMTFEKIFL